MTPACTASACLMAAALSCTSPARGQPAPAVQAASAPAALPEIRVKVGAERETATGPVPGYAARRTATATRTDTPLNEVPQSVSVIGAEQVRDQASPNLQEALRYTAGIRAETYGVDNRGDWFSLRGGSDGTILVDGLRRPGTGYWDLVRSEPFAFERIEVLRGPASLIAGQNGPGGVVNLVSKRPQADPAREVGAQLGSHDHRQAQGDFTGPVDSQGKLLYRLVGLVKRSDTQVKHAFDDRDLLAGELAWRADAATSISVFAQYQRDESGNLNAFFPAAGTLLPASHGPIPMDTFIGEPGWDTFGGTRMRLGWRVEHRFGDAWTLRHSLRNDRTKGSMRTMYVAWWEGFVDASGAPDPDGTYLNRVFYAADDEDRITNVDLLLEGRLRAGGTAHTLLVGFDGFDRRSGQRYYGDFPATPLDVYHPVYGTFALPGLPETPNLVTRARRLGALVQDQIKIDDRWVVVAGLRRDRARTAVEDGEASTDWATTKNLGGVWLIEPAWSPYLGYSESFNPVGGTDAAGALFKPQRGKQVEAGGKWQPPDRRLTASAAVYRLREKNRLAPDPDRVGFSVQRGEVTVRGVELEAAGRVGTWELSAQYSYTDAQITATTPDDSRYLGQQLEAIPKHTAGVWLVHRFAGVPGLRAGAGVRHVGESFDGTGGLRVHAVTLLDAMVGYDAGAWRFALNANNLTDEAYVASCLERGDCWFGQRRRVVATISYLW